MQLSTMTAGWRNEDKISAAPNMTAIIGGTTKLLVACGGKASDLPVEWYARRCNEYTNPFTDLPIEIAPLGKQPMIRITTNYAPDHAFVVAPDVPLSLWGGGVIKASDAKDRQLHGRYGMYVVRSVSTVDTAAYRVTNISTAGDIFLW